jgi:hypothetical protein
VPFFPNGQCRRGRKARKPGDARHELGDAAHLEDALAYEDIKIGDEA